MPTRTIAIGDIHGCSAALEALLDALRPRPEDIIVTLGDYINRGPDSRGVLDRLIRLKHQCRLIPLLGNHEEMLFEAVADTPEYFLGVGGDATLDSYGPGRDLNLIPDEHDEFLKGCLDYHETDTHIFVHANYFPDLPMSEQHVGTLRWESLRDMAPGPHDSGKTVVVVAHGVVNRVLLSSLIESASPSDFARFGIEHVAVNDLRWDGRRWRLAEFPVTSPDPAGETEG